MSDSSDSSEQTRFARIEDFAWKVYRVHTRSSAYVLGLYNWDGRRFAVLRGTSEGLGGRVDLRDSDPKIGGRSLFEVKPEEWVGKVLEVSTATTSPVRSVEEERDSSVITGVRAVVVPGGKAPAERMATPRAAEERRATPVEPPFPENFVHEMEIASYLIARANRHPELLVALAGEAELLERFKVALAGCLVSAKSLGQKLP